MFSRSVGFLHFLDSVLSHIIVCNFDVKFIYFFSLVACAFGVISKKLLPRSKVMKIYTQVSF